MPKLTLNDGISLYYEIIGPELNVEDVPTFIFIHGAPGLFDSRLYKYFWGKFGSDSLRVLFLDQRGSGRSDDGPISKLHIKQHAKDINELCQKLHIEMPIVGGVSQGGYVSLAYASMFPDNLRASILCNTEAKRNTEERVVALIFSLVNYFGKSHKEAEQIAEALKKCDANWTNEAYKQFLPYYAKNPYRPDEIASCVGHPVTWEKFMKGEFPIFDLSSGLINITCPVLYLAGQYDGVHPPACARKTISGMSKADVTYHEIKDAADPVYRDQFENAGNIIKEFLITLNFGKRNSYSCSN